MKFKVITTAIIIASCSMAFASTPKSVNVLKFGSENTLFIGDSKSATLYAYSIESSQNETAQQGYNIHDLSQKIAAFAKINLMDILVRDMAINPVNKEAYIAFDTKTKTGYASHVVIVSQSGSIRNLDLKKTKHTEVKLLDALTSDYKFWGTTSMRSFTFTDIDLHKGKVYVSGMSNAEFSSALRMVDFPFNDSKVSTTSVEIFHTVHGQMETRAPIQTLSFITLDDGDYILAAYTCTPLVLIPVKDLKDGAHVVGKTIAEMGFGNTPIDIIKFKSAGMDKVPYEGVILSNKNKSAQFINLTDINKSNKMEAIGYAGDSETGTTRKALPMTSLLQLDDQDDYHITAIKRNPDTGSLELISYLKNVYLRLDEFVSEYDFPDYKYEGQQLQTKGFQNMMIQDLGKTEFIKK
jgi:hypothetical protein